LAGAVVVAGFFAAAVLVGFFGASAIFFWVEADLPVVVKVFEGLGFGAE